MSSLMYGYSRCQACGELIIQIDHYQAGDKGYCNPLFILHSNVELHIWLPVCSPTGAYWLIARRGDYSDEVDRGVLLAASAYGMASWYVEGIANGNFLGPNAVDIQQ